MVQTGRGVMKTVGMGGDTRIRWTHGNETETEAARTNFNTLRGKGYRAYRMDAGVRVGMPLGEFDPNAEEIILVPRMAGG